MSFDFPNSPAENDEFSPPGSSHTYVYKAPRWTVKSTASSGGGAATSIGIAPPVGAIAGQLWWDSDEGKFYIYYNDGNTSQWVEAVSPNIDMTAFVTQVQLDARTYMNTTSAGIFTIQHPAGSIGTVTQLAFRDAAGIARGYVQTDNSIATGRIMINCRNSAGASAGTLSVEADGFFASSGVYKGTLAFTADIDVDGHGMFGPGAGSASNVGTGVTCFSSGVVYAKMTGVSHNPAMRVFNNADVTPRWVGTFGSTGEYSLISNEAGGSGIVLRPTAYNSATGQAMIEPDGVVTIASSLVANSGTLYAMAGNVVAGPSASSSSVNPAAISASTGQFTSRKAGTAAQTHFQCINNVGPGTGVSVGQIQSSGTTSTFVGTSDERLKDFIGEYDPQRAIDIIRADPVRDYHWNEKSNSPGKYGVGWGAQTSYAVDPDLAVPPVAWEFDPNTPEITEEPQPGQPGYMPWGIDPARRTPYLWAALSAALDKIDALEARLAALEAAS